jgi:hypothetical protein
LQGVERIVVQAFSRDDHESPALALEGLPSSDVIQPIGADLAMVPAVVLDDDLQFGILRCGSAGESRALAHIAISHID